MYMLSIPEGADEFMDAIRNRDKKIITFGERYGISAWNIPEGNFFIISTNQVKTKLQVSRSAYEIGLRTKIVKLEDILPMALIQSDEALLEYILSL